MSKVAVHFDLNGKARSEFVDGGATLLDLLRTRIGDMSPKAGCLQGSCGCCTVLIDGEPRLACITLAEDVQGREVETARGLPDGAGRLHPLQQAFIDGFATQCGFCTPGMLMAAKALLNRKPNPTRADVIDAISGNFCRCTGYAPIIDAILAAAEAGRAA
ncbi:MAG: (2Fe-2S)-binding protein [Sphingobium sp.]|uniref:(2Fe-2S)-binding protein n=1 Tax=Sphingobium sp. TaxID=1912891 RepID=UPI002E1E7ABF